MHISNSIFNLTMAVCKRLEYMLHSVTSRPYSQLMTKRNKLLDAAVFVKKKNLYNKLAAFKSARREYIVE